LVIAAIVLIVAWRKGGLLKLAKYVGETNVELKKCNWPSTDELKSSTVLVMVSVIFIGFLTFGIDWLFAQVVQALM
tara:strand:+ start:1524 stop:1751 length:228 start_codon:yes stop_codon:yes gene_type:complete